MGYNSWACLRREPHCSDAHECILHISVCHTKADLDRLITPDGIGLFILEPWASKTARHEWKPY